MQSREKLRTVLLWAAGAAVEPDFAGLSVETVLRAVHAHRLDGRLLARADGVPPEVLRAVQARYADIEAKVEGRIAVLQELGRAVRDRDPDDRVVMLKGFTRFALTGARHSLRFSSDMDLICRDLDAFVDIAEGMGFDRVGPKDHLAEYACLILPGRAYVELHSHYPITTLDVADAAELAPGAHPGAWEQLHRYAIHRIDRAELVEHSVESPVVPGIHVLRPELAVLVHAAHLFIDTMRYPHPLGEGTARLDEIATVVDLARLPGFDRDLLSRFARRHGAELALDTTRRLAADLLGVDPFGDAAPRLPGNPPRNLWWDGLPGGFPVDLGWDPGQFVVCDTTMADLVAALQGDVVQLGAPGTTVPVTLPCDGSSPAPRHIYRREPGDKFQVRYEFRADETGLTVDVVVPAVEAGRMTGVAFYLDRHRYEFFWDAGRDTPVRFADYTPHDAMPEISATGEPPPRDPAPIAYDVRRDAVEEVLHACFPWSALGGEEDVSLLLSTRQQRLPWGPMTGGCVLPIRLARGLPGRR
jgi:hypothetical protein